MEEMYFPPVNNDMDDEESLVSVGSERSTDGIGDQDFLR